MNCNPNDEHEPQEINPATGLPMVDHMGIDVGGSPYGVDVYHQWTPPIYNDWQPCFDH